MKKIIKLQINKLLFYSNSVKLKSKFSLIHSPSQDQTSAFIGTIHINF